MLDRGQGNECAIHCSYRLQIGHVHSTRIKLCVILYSALIAQHHETKTYMTSIQCRILFMK